MDSPLQTAPIGLLGALDLKTLGLNPNVFSGTLVPVVDCWDVYLADHLKVVTATGTIGVGSSGGVVNIPVPQGYMWRLLDFGVTALLNVADIAFTSSWVTSLARTPSTTSAILSNLSVLGAAGSLSRSGGLLVPHPLWLPAAWQIQTAVALSANATVAVTLTGRVLVHEFQT